MFGFCVDNPGFFRRKKLMSVKIKFLINYSVPRLKKEQTFKKPVIYSAIRRVTDKLYGYGKCSFISTDKGYNIDRMRNTCYGVFVEKDDPVEEISIIIMSHSGGGRPPGFDRLNSAIRLFYSINEKWYQKLVSMTSISRGHLLFCKCDMPDNLESLIQSTKIIAQPKTIFSWRIEQSMYTPCQDSFSKKNMRVRNLTKQKYEEINFSVLKVKNYDDQKENIPDLDGNEAHVLIKSGESEGWCIGDEYQLECNNVVNSDDGIKLIHAG